MRTRGLSSLPAGARRSQGITHPVCTAHREAIPLQLALHLYMHMDMYMAVHMCVYTTQAHVHVICFRATTYVTPFFCLSTAAERNPATLVSSWSSAQEWNHEQSAQRVLTEMKRQRAHP